jgi:hypothetical protein
MLINFNQRTKYTDEKNILFRRYSPQCNHGTVQGMNPRLFVLFLP